jgi:nucleoside-diphosphate-sugar epimerase
VPQVVERALDAKPILVSQPHVVRDYVFVDDVVELLVAAAGAAEHLRGEVVNCGSGVAMTLRDVVDTVLRVTRSGSEVQWGAFALAEHDELHPIADPALAREALGWTARTSFDDGVSRVVAHVLSRRGTAAPGA